MRAVFSIAGLLIVLAVVGVLVKQQLSATRLATTPAVGTANAPEQARQQVEQIKNDLNQALQQGAARTQAAD